MSASRTTPRPAGSDAGCGVLHVDMDAFYAAVEIRSRPELRGRPVIVGGGPERGVVLSASYEARAFGVRSAMPSARAHRLCPQAVFLRPDFTTYAEVSRAVMAVFRSVTPLVQPLSLDEAFLDVSGALRRLGTTPLGVAASIREEVAASQGITCSVGVASTMFVAKLASRVAKPDGVHLVPADGVRAFLDPLPVGALWGVGAKTEEVLGRHGISTVADVAAAGPSTLRRAVGEAHAAHLLALAHGVDERRVDPHGREKSAGAEETFDRDLVDPALRRRELLRLADRTARMLRRRGVRARTVALKVRFDDFTTITRARTLPAPTDLARDLHAVAVELHDALGDVPPVRLLGVRGEGLVDADRAPEQIVLGEPEHGWSDAERAADQARSRFGVAAVRPASLLGDPDPQRARSPSEAGDPARRRHRQHSDACRAGSAREPNG
ncbi:DNA polymerase IV [Actinomycetospora lemnae]|uniref:DNA polymerase IV n=1 Tax=Actinomycetospora lemnae TaxID=3019891 RepID=A0ABT5SZ41_9PSEU|nr:DNA polymerase IV [Actinomycetospora sp. DW7H6]MDD7968138.1 DNA polymerase IV [Actinomycetospora sp. DW7H6]